MQYLLIYSVIMAALIILAAFAIKARAEERRRMRMNTLFSYIRQYQDMFEKSTEVGIRRDILANMEQSLEALAQLGADPKRLNEGHEDLHERTKRTNAQAVRKKAQVLIKQLEFIYDTSKKREKIAAAKALFEDAISDGQFEAEAVAKDVEDLLGWERMYEFDESLQAMEAELAEGLKDKVTAQLYALKTEINAKPSTDDEDKRQLFKLDDLLARMEESSDAPKDGAETDKSS